MPSELQSQLGRIARGGALGLVGALVSALAGFLLVVLITNNYDQQTAGVVFSASSLFLIVLGAATLGTDVGLGRFVLRHVAEGRPDAVRACLRTSMLSVAAASLVATALLVGFAEPVADLLGLDPGEGPLVVTIFAAALPLSCLGGVALAGTRAFGAIRPTVAVERLGRSLGQPALVGLCLLAPASVLTLSAAWVAPYVAAAVVSFLVLHRLLHRAAPAVAGPPADHGQIRREFWAFTWTRAVASLAQIVITRADIILVGALISPSAAAVYTAATRFVALGKFGVQAIQQVLQPQLTHLLATRQMDVLREVFKTSTAWNVAIAWPLYLAVGCAPAVYLSIFGDDFASSATTTVVVMMFGMLIGTYSGPVDTLLLMAGRSTASLVNSLVALVVDLGLCLVLIPRIGMAGAAIAWAAAVALRSVLSYVQVRRTLDVSPISKASALTAGAAVLCFAVPMLVLSITGRATPASFVLVGLAGLVLYVVILWLGRRTLQLRALRSLLGRRQSAPELERVS